MPDTKASILVVDDDNAFRFAMRKALGRLGYQVFEAPNGETALAHLRGAKPPDVALLDLHMDGIDGIEVLRRRGAVRTPIIVLTGHGSVRAAVEAMQLGAFSFLEKPVDADALGPLLQQAIHDKASRGGNADADGTPALIGISRGMQDVRDFIARVGPTDETVAISGETGSGKEVVARNLHASSRRAHRPFVALNAACVPHDLFESELFGHRKGAFTGASHDHPGLFREAEGGTLFIDEVAELPVDSQAKLLRALEVRAIRPVGSAKEEPVDVRIVAATNRDLWSEVKAGRFREDLFFRLQVFPIVIQPLRARKEDVIPLAEHLLGRIGGDHALSSEAREAIVNYDWPGNVRELLNVLRRACLFAAGSEIDGDTMRRMLAASVFAHPATNSPVPAPSDEVPLASLADLERSHIERVLEQSGGNVTQAAQTLGIDRRTLQRKLRGYGLGG
ncbi:MAG: sigma-54-dependent Fis family transcriptional regulator [Myxococcales bacterium]|nr:sigma-54-dependent Fis family transcriptional regulator [Myxococcales bacterium]